MIRCMWCNSVVSPEQEGEWMSDTDACDCYPRRHGKQATNMVHALMEANQLLRQKMGQIQQRLNEAMCKIRRMEECQKQATPSTSAATAAELPSNPTPTP